MCVRESMLCVRVCGRETVWGVCVLERVCCDGMLFVNVNVICMSVVRVCDVYVV